MEVPEAEKFTVYDVTPCVFTQEQVDKIAAYFFKGAPLFSEEDVRTKAEIQSELIMRKRDLEETKKADFKTKEAVLRDIKGQIKDLEKQYAKAPEERKRTPATTKLIENKYGDSELYVMADLGKDAEARLDVVSSTVNMHNYISFSNDGKGGYNRMGLFDAQTGAPKGMTMTQNEANKLVMQFLRIWA